jgi:hypothetical protein
MRPLSIQYAVRDYRQWMVDDHPHEALAQVLRYVRFELRRNPCWQCHIVLSRLELEPLCGR